MSGIYIHIPFCRRKCHYCNFFSVVSVKYRAPLLKAIEEEIFIQRNYLSGNEITSIYFGGGTPSVLDPAEIGTILTTIKKYHPVAKDVEITIEVNPDDFGNLQEFVFTAENTENFKEVPEDKNDLNACSVPSVVKKEAGVSGTGIFNVYRSLGINRLSIGIQSFFNDDLEYLNRIHSSEQALNTVKAAQAAGFGNINIDLIYGIPTLTAEKWLKNLEIAFSLNIRHISAYSLTVEPKTALDVLIRKNKISAPLEENAVNHFRILMERMRNEGFLHYEISNFCREGFYSQHNKRYWSGEHYLGIGPSAHSYNGNSRQWNVASIIEYIDQIRRGERFFESELLTPSQKYNEYVMTSLRTMWGCDSRKITAEFGEEAASGFRLQASGFIEKGWMIEKEEVFSLTDNGKLFADGIASELFIT